MPKYRSIMLQHRAKPAGKRRLCRHDKRHVIEKGEPVLEIKNGMTWFGYCWSCSQKILQLATNEISTVTQTGQALK